MTCRQPARKKAVADSGNYNDIHEEQVVKDGSYITFRKIQTGESVDAMIQAEKFPLHKQMVGKKVGDVVNLMGKKYEITDIL